MHLTIQWAESAYSSLPAHWLAKAHQKGVFVTTSSFTSGAVQYAQRVPQRIILISGSELTRLMMEYGVGVRTDRTVEVKRIDLDYFEEPEE